MAGPEISSPLGSVAAFRERPCSFVRALDANVWVNWWLGAAGWEWVNMKRPPGRSVDAAMGAIAVDGRPYLFVQASDGKGDYSDGNLWVCSWSAAAGWEWANLERPPGVTLGAPMGAITVDNKRPYVFVLGDDGNLWLKWQSGTAWAWTNQGRPDNVTLKASMGAITVDGGRPYVFVKGSDGNLWLNWWSGKAWAWTNQGHPPDVKQWYSMGATTVDGGRPYVFIQGDIGSSEKRDLWVHWWSGKAWAWTNLGHPPGVTGFNWMGTTTVDGGRPHVFLRSSDSGKKDLWVNYWSGTAWAWANRSHPKGVDLSRRNGAITFVGGGPYVFIAGNTGKGVEDRLWLNSRSGKDWAWTLQG